MQGYKLHTLLSPHHLCAHSGGSACADIILLSHLLGLARFWVAVVAFTLPRAMACIGALPLSRTVAPNFDVRPPSLTKTLPQPLVQASTRVCDVCCQNGWGRGWGMCVAFLTYSSTRMLVRSFFSGFSCGGVEACKPGGWLDWASASLVPCIVPLSPLSAAPVCKRASLVRAEHCIVVFGSKSVLPCCCVGYVLMPLRRCLVVWVWVTGLSRWP